MFSFVKKLFGTKESKDSEQGQRRVETGNSVSANRRRDNIITDGATGIAAGDVVNDEIAAASVKFSKPEEYTGNRLLYDDAAAKESAKAAAFGNKKIIKDPYTGQKMVRTRAESREMFGDIGNSAETDHVVPLHKIHGEMKDNPWVTNEDIKRIANSDENLVVASNRFNNYKRDKSNSEVVQDTNGLKGKNISMSKARKRRALEDEENAQYYIQKQEAITSITNVIETGHQAGVNTATVAGSTAGAISLIQNFVAVIRGQKNAGEAMADTIADGGKAALTGYAMGGGLTVLGNTLTSASSPFLKSLAKSNVPGQVVAAVMTFGGTLKKYANGEITTQQFMLETGTKGLSVATAGYAFAAGQAIIPIPIIGGAIGAVVGTLLTESYYADLMAQLERKELEHQERLRIIAECQRATAQAKAYREELEKYLEEYFKDCRNCFDDALSTMHNSYIVGDADGVIVGANKITKKLGGNVYFENVTEYKNFLDSDEPDIL